MVDYIIPISPTCTAEENVVDCARKTPRGAPSMWLNPRTPVMRVHTIRRSLLDTTSTVATAEANQ